MAHAIVISAWRRINAIVEMVGGALPASVACQDHLAPIFIVGAPRTGSTILYQLLTNDFRVGYPDNLAALLFGSLPLGVLVSRVFWGDRPHNNFDSLHGDTRRGGWHAPAEYGDFWYRWLPKNDHFAGSDALPDRACARIRTEILTATRLFGAPLIFKNLNAGQRLGLIRRIFPNARIIWCRRDALAIIRSILDARKRLDWPDDKLWSIRPRNWRELENLPPVRQVAAQVRQIEHQIETDLRLFGADRSMTIRYEDLMANSDRTIEEIGAWLSLQRRENRDRRVAVPVRSAPGKQVDFPEDQMREIRAIFPDA